MQNRWQLLLWPCDWCWKTNNSKIANCDLVTDSMIQIIVRVLVGKKWFVILSYDRHPFGPRLVAVKLYHKSITVWVQEMQRSFPCLNFWTPIKDFLINTIIQRQIQTRVQLVQENAIKSFFCFDKIDYKSKCDRLFWHRLLMRFSVIAVLTRIRIFTSSVKTVQILTAN